MKWPLTGCLCLFSSGVSAQLEQNFTQLKFPHLHTLLVFVPTKLMSNPLDGLLHLSLCKTTHFQPLPEGSPATGAAGESLGIQRKTIRPGFPERRGREACCLLCRAAAVVRVGDAGAGGHCERLRLPSLSLGRL